MHKQLAYIALHNLRISAYIGFNETKQSPETGDGP